MGALLRSPFSLFFESQVGVAFAAMSPVEALYHSFDASLSRLFALLMPFLLQALQGISQYLKETPNLLRFASRHFLWCWVVEKGNRKSDSALSTVRFASHGFECSMLVCLEVVVPTD